MAKAGTEVTAAPPIKIAPPARMLAALKALGIKTP
jgi:hypothetical protein